MWLFARSPSDQILHISCQCFSLHITQEPETPDGKVCTRAFSRLTSSGSVSARQSMGGNQHRAQGLKEFGKRNVRDCGGKINDVLNCMAELDIVVMCQSNLLQAILLFYNLHCSHCKVCFNYLYQLSKQNT